MNDYYFDETLKLMHICCEALKLPDNEEPTNATLDDLADMGFNVIRG